MPQMLCGREGGRLASPGDKEPTLGPGAILSPWELWVGSGVQIAAATNLITPLKTARNERRPARIPLSFVFFCLGRGRKNGKRQHVCVLQKVFKKVKATLYWSLLTSEMTFLLPWH